MILNMLKKFALPLVLIITSLVLPAFIDFKWWPVLTIIGTLIGAYIVIKENSIKKENDTPKLAIVPKETETVNVKSNTQKVMSSLRFKFLFKRAASASEKYQDKKWNVLVGLLMEDPNRINLIRPTTEKQEKVYDYILKESKRVEKEFKNSLKSKGPTRKPSKDKK